MVKALGLQRSCISFSVVTFDDDKTVIMDSAVDESDIYDTDEFIDYCSSTGKTKVEVSYEYFILGADVETDYATDEQKEYILENLEDVTSEATSLDEGSFIARVPEEEIDEYETEEPDEPEVEIIDEPEDSIEQSDEEQEPVTEARPVITAAELSIGDKFRLRGREYTIVSMDGGIYPDDVVISKIENMAGVSYSVTENFDRFRLIREGEYLGNPEKETQKQAEYNPHIGDIIELDGTNLYEIEDISGDEVTFREMDTLFADTLRMPLSDLYTHDFEVVNENEYYKKQDDYVPEDDTVSIDEAAEDEVSSDDISADIPEKREENAPKARNYVINDDNIGVATPKVRYADNIAAIRTLKLIESEERTATPEEQAVLVKYTGWGAIPQVFDSSNDKWKDEYEELQGLLTDEEYSAARKSTMNAHYTSPTVINAIYKGLENMGFKVGKILEPAVGTGNFFGRLPENMGASLTDTEEEHSLETSDIQTGETGVTQSDNTVGSEMEGSISPSEAERMPASPVAPEGQGSPVRPDAADTQEPAKSAGPAERSQPGQPLQLRYTKRGENRYTLSWSDTGSAHYYVERRAPGEDDFTTVAQPGEGQLSYDTGVLRAGREYVFRVYDVEETAASVEAIGDRLAAIFSGDRYASSEYEEVTITT
ncbi:MAG: fibronectin type III domain-containing protein, partial [Oscillospiraceae bacterium]|nr:fibronectin type III domain-containing protein [Oscillospiraceae bacterium]